ncbi:MAG: monovalent cation/H+ antiporter subunit D [Gemmatimonadales bacterium]|nr:monovalent cation/H+ antiporter subunit D [Gemmatimonadales bacterium]
MTHLVMGPILLPLATAVALAAMGGRRARLEQAISLTATALLLLLSLLLLRSAAAGETSVYRPGDWPSPFGIVLLLDRLSALMLVATSLVALGSVAYACLSGLRARYYHALFQFQLAGLSGAFLTADLFNLFVFFEILLIASYCLLTLGPTRSRLRAGLHYVVINLVGSTLFLVAVGTLYGLTGTLNLADLALRVAALPAADATVARSAALLLFAVFALKAAVVPLHLWLPGTYAAAAPPVAALFAIMTKVGVYGIIRVATLVFGPDAGVAAAVAGPWLLPVALATQMVGMAGALATRDLRRMQGYFLIGSVGTILTGVGLFTHEGLTAALYYLVHSTFTIAAMFLLADLIRRRSAGGGALGLLFLFGAMAVVGLPPWSGFIGKALVLAAAPLDRVGAWVWGVTLLAGLVGVMASARMGGRLFWLPAPAGAAVVAVRRVRRSALAPVLGLFGAVVLLTVFGDAVTRYTRATADQLFAPQEYVRAVLPGR